MPRRDPRVAWDASPGVPAIVEVRAVHALPEHLLAAMHSFLDTACILTVTDTQGRIVFVNDAFCRISGYAREELLGQTHRLVKSDVHPPEFYATLWRTIARGELWRGEICNRAKNGALYWVDATLTPIRDGNARITHYLALRVDITARKQAEARLIEQERLATLGHLADRVAHDINNFLTVAIVAVGQPGDDHPANLDLTRKALQGISQLTHSLRDISRERSSTRQAFDLGNAVRCAAGMALYRTRVHADTFVKTDVGNLHGVYLVGIESEITSALLNVILNAVEAAGSGQPAAVRITGDLVDNVAHLSVQDHGPGVPAAFVPQLFTDQASTKGPGRGRGLASARRIALAHGGDLTYEGGSPGALFRFRFPLA